MGGCKGDGLAATHPSLPEETTVKKVTTPPYHPLLPWDKNTNNNTSSRKERNGQEKVASVEEEQQQLNHHPKMPGNAESVEKLNEKSSIKSSCSSDTSNNIYSEIRSTNNNNGNIKSDGHCRRQQIDSGQQKQLEEHDSGTSGGGIWRRRRKVMFSSNKFSENLSVMGDANAKEDEADNNSSDPTNSENAQRLATTTMSKQRESERWRLRTTTPLLLLDSTKSLPSTLSIIYGVYLFFISLQVTLAARQEVSSNCTFPQKWEGTWFQSGLQQPIHIKGSKLSFRGTCIASDGDKFLMADDKCRRCVVIYEKHKNVLQYKESECDDMYMDQSNPASASNPLPIQQMRTLIKSSDHNINNNNHNSNSRGGAHPNTNGGHSRSSSDPYLFRSNDDIDNCFCRGRETLQNLCEQIPGDALLYSMFKENAEPVRCPLKGPFTFTYNRGHGECRSPVSNIESCTEDSRLLLSFQACPDVTGTESTVEELTCLATWKDGNSRYLVGLVSHHHATSNEERYRCFVYEKMSGKEAEYKLAQSGDATCNGLDSAEVGSRIMTLRKAPPADRCDFPQWFKGRKHWHALMGNVGYSFHQSDGSMHITKASGVMETRALCEQINKQTSTEMMSVVHYTTGCQSGFMCMMFYRRDTHVAEIQMGSPASRLEDACAPDHFDLNKLPYITLLASNPESEVCPMEGLYGLRGVIGPPFVPSRHKRNHNNRNHNHNRSAQHLHDASAGSSAIAPSSGHRRHGSLSFRNSEQMDHNSWHAQTRGLSVRNRRDAVLAIDQKESSTSSAEGAAVAAAATSNSAAEEGQRSRRDVPNCVINPNSRRNLLIGCTKTNVIEVRPQCNDEGDEAYTCHGSWTHNQTTFIVAKHVGFQHGVCISYRPMEADSAQLIIGDACFRGMQSPPEHHLVANLTVYERAGQDRETKCSNTNAATIINRRMERTVISLLIITLIMQCWLR